MFMRLLVLWVLLSITLEGENFIEFKTEKGFTAKLPFLPKTNYSAMGWVRLPGTTSGSDCILALGEDNFYKSAFSVYYSLSPKLGFTLFTGKGVKWKHVDVAKETWVHLALIYNTKTNKTDLYLNGRYIVSSVQPQFPQPVRPEHFKFSLGVNLNHVEGLNAAYDNWSIWRGSLTSFQVDKDYNFGYGNKLTGQEEGLIAYFDFDRAEDKLFRSQFHRITGTASGDKDIDFTRPVVEQKAPLLIEFIQENDELQWAFSDESIVEKYVIIDAENAEVIKVIKAGGADRYSVTTGSTETVQLMVVADSGFQSIFSPVRR